MFLKFPRDKTGRISARAFFHYIIRKGVLPCETTAAAPHIPISEFVATEDFTDLLR